MALADATMASKRRVLGRFGAWLGSAGITTDLGGHDANVAVAYLAACRSDGYQAVSVALFAKILRAFSTRAFALDLIPRDVYRGLRIPRLKRTVLVVLTQVEVARLVRVAGDDPRPWVGPAVLILVGCGRRVGEVVRLQWTDIRLTESTMFVRGKGGHERVVGMPMAVRIALRRLAAARPSASAAVIGVGKSQVARTVARLGRRTGLDKAILPHTLRRTYATLALRAGASLAAIARTLGHASTSTTERWYVQLDTPDLLAAARFPPVSEPDRSTSPT